jgi:hypothetical protein
VRMLTIFVTSRVTTNGNECCQFVDDICQFCWSFSAFCESQKLPLRHCCKPPMQGLCQAPFSVRVKQPD